MITKNFVPECKARLVKYKHLWQRSAPTDPPHTMSNKEKASDGLQESLTAIDYINQQEELEREARILMPFDPNECTYELGELRQQVYACLTCSRTNDNQPIGVCYSCSIQCHSKHELVELFTKRSFYVIVELQEWQRPLMELVT